MRACDVRDAGAGLHRVSVARDPGGARRAGAAAARAYRLVDQGAGAREVAEAVELIREAKQPILLVGHGVHTARTGAPVKALAELIACPVIQTSGGTSFIQGLEDRTFPYGFSPSAVEAVVKSDLCIAIGTELGEPVHYGKGRHWARERRQPQVDLRRAGSARDRREPADRRAAGRRSARRRSAARRGAQGFAALAVAELDGWVKTGRRRTGGARGDRSDAAGRPSIPRASWSRRPRRSRRTASWCATAAPP